MLNSKSFEILLYCAIFVAAGVILVVHWGDPIDDAYISFRYARNLADGAGFVFNEGERVEGYSNFLLIIILAVGKKVGFQIPVVAQFLGLMATLGTVALSGWWARELLGNEEDNSRISRWAVGGVIVLCAADVHTGIWAVSGLETPLIAFLLLALSISFRKNYWILFGILALLLVLLRPLGFIPGVILLALRILHIRTRASELSWRDYLGSGIFIIGMVAYAGWRWNYFGTLTPTTASAKVDILGPMWGILYAANYAIRRPLIVGLAGGTLLLLLRNRRQHTGNVIQIGGVPTSSTWSDWAPLVLPVFAYVGALLAAGGDWMPDFRFLVPAMPVLFLLAMFGAKHLAESEIDWVRALGPTVGIACVALAIGNTARYAFTDSFHKTWHTEQKRFYAEPERWVRENVAANSVVALGDIGHIAYGAPIKVVDTMGLIDPHLAAIQGSAAYSTDVDYVLGRKPDYIIRMVNNYPQGSIGHVAFDREISNHPDFLSHYTRVVTLPGYAAEEDVFGLWTQPKKYFVEFEIYSRKNES